MSGSDAGATEGAPTARAQPTRVFVGLKIAPEISTALAQLAATLERLPVTIIKPADIHLTLVPPWSETAIPDAVDKLCGVAGAFGDFWLTFQRVGYGPQPKRPRLLWASCAASDEIVALHAALIRAYGQTDERPFHPHVTLARIRAHGPLIARKHPIDRPLSLRQHVGSVELFQSPLPGEAGYRILASLRLGKTASVADLKFLRSNQAL